MLRFSSVRNIKLFLLSGLLLIMQSAFAQQGGGLRGQIVDEAKDAVELASVSLLRLPDSTIVKDMQTSLTGRFEFTDVAAGNYAIRISFVGFVQKVVGNIQIGTTSHNLGVITLSQDAGLLDAVVIERTAPAVEYGLDRTTFNMTPDIQSMSVNATEVLEQIPMVEMDEEGSPSVMGQNLTVLIDGRPSTVYGSNIATVLKLVPSGTIEKVEVITSPSARYTTEQGGIVLNIVTKSNRLIGVSGIATLAATTANRYSPSINVNVTRNRIGFNNSISFDAERDPSNSSIFRQNLLSPTFSTDQKRNGLEKESDFSYNGNLFYEVTDKSTIGVFFGVGRDTENEDETLITRTLDNNDQLTSGYNRAIRSESEMMNYRAGIDFKKTFANEDQILDVQAYYSTRDNDETEIFDQQSDWDELDYLQRQVSTGGDEGFTVQADYVQPLGEKSSLEAGFRGRWEEDNDQFNPYQFDNQLGDYVIITDRMDDLTSKDQRYSLYTMYRTSIERLSIQAGARLEKSVLDAEQPLLGQSYSNNFLNLIPTLNLAYRLKNEDNIKVSYSRRARSPRWNQLSPFIDYSNPENIQSGNPELKPSVTNSFEFSYGKFINQFNLFASVFYRNSNNPIQRVTTLNSEGISFTTFDNIGKENYYGLETGASADIIPKWNVRLNVGVRKSEVLGFDRENSNVSLTGRFSTFFPLPYGFRGYAFVRYMGPRAIAQGEMKGMLISDIGLRKSVMDQKVNLSLRLSDVFNNQQFSRTLTQPNFIEVSDFRRQSRYLSFSISYTFGSLKEGAARNSDDQEPTMGGDMNGGMDGGMGGGDVGGPM
ncbi:TonB-dependent receptor domain-containing protein [Albibacterium sp.]|uniref:TonB-dependent receptor domain-containing protein n=1 Tax=Albibacterium sp. TaxID=2952885 RepID=UPI002BF064A7|nr:TonB-dependent receptor [Albibacterium sp.]HUH17644.1 TonB-dependent receptor [Albibacterium sp.]